MTTTPPAALSNVEEALVSALGDAVSTAPERLDAYVADTYWPALHAAAAGSPIARPDVVVRPRTEEDVAEVVAASPTSTASRSSRGAAARARRAAACRCMAAS